MRRRICEQIEWNPIFVLPERLRRRAKIWTRMVLSLYEIGEGRGMEYQAGISKPALIVTGIVGLLQRRRKEGKKKGEVGLR